MPTKIKKSHTSKLPESKPYTSTSNAILRPNPLDLRDPAQRWWKWFQDTDPEQEVESLTRTWNGWATWWFGDCTGRMVDAAILYRQMIGDGNVGSHETHLRERLLEMSDRKDGLSWRPETIFNVHEANMFDQSSVLLALVTWLQESGSAKIDGYIRRMVKGLSRIAARDGESLHYPFECYCDGGWDREYPVKNGKSQRYGVADPCHEGGRQINPLVRYYELTGSSEALRLAEGLAHYVMGPADLFLPDGSYREEKRKEKTYRSGHVHSRLSVATGIMRLGFATDCEEYVNWGKRIFDWTLQTQCTSFGWVGEVVDEYKRGCETCGITDAIEAAALLARHGHDAYWSLVERIARNHLLESQSRRIGGFNGHSLPNDFAFTDACWVPGAVSVLHPVAGCCAPAGMRGLYGVWSQSVTRHENIVSVNLSLNRESRWVSVLGNEPLSGQMEIKIHDAPVLRIRVPEGVEKDKVKVAVNGRQVSPPCDGSFLKLSNCAPGETVSVQYPLRSRTAVEIIHGNTFTVDWIGSTVVGISPAGQYEPLYVRRNAEWYTTAPSMVTPLPKADEVYW